MRTIAKNLISGKNLEKTYNKLADLLHENNRIPEQCYTYESICRLLTDKKDIEKYKQRILEENFAFCTNSYEKYTMKQNSLEHEFPIEKNDNGNDIILNYTDIYLGLIHLLMVTKNVDDILKISADLYKIKEKINFIAKYLDNDIAQHALSVIENEEYRLADELANDSNIEVLKLAVKYGNTDIKTFLSIFFFYTENKQLKELFDFYNNFYAIVFNKPLIKSNIELGKELAAIAYSNKHYHKAVNIEKFFAEEDLKNE